MSTDAGGDASPLSSPIWGRWKCGTGKCRTRNAGVENTEMKMQTGKCRTWNTNNEFHIYASVTDTGCTCGSRFHSNFVQTLITWHLMYHELSRSVGQMSRSQCDITYQHKKRYNSGTFKLSKVKIIPEPSETRNAMFKDIRSNTEITITSLRKARIAQLRSNLVQSFITSQVIRCKCSRSKVKGHGDRVKDKVTA